MNAIEKFIYRLVKRNPKLKAALVRGYQSLFASLPFVELRSLSPVVLREGYFFGFHDKCPWSIGDEFLLAHRLLIGNRVVRAGDEVEVGYFGGKSWQKFNPIARTQAWDWQLGAMLQWVSRTEVLFNGFEDGVYKANICDINSREIRKLGYPIAAVSSDGKRGVSYDFDRLHVAMPGYGYACREANRKWSDEDFPDRGNLRCVDLDTGDVKRTITLEEIRRIEPDATMDKAFHFFHHPLFAPGSRRFVFFHRWVRNRNQRFTRMFSCDADGGGLYVFPTTGMASHIGWRDSEHLLAYANVDGEDGFYLFQDRGKSPVRVGEEAFDSDGHPQFSVENKILVDTYPNRFRLQYLAVYDPNTRIRKDIVRTRLPREFVNETKVDLHPRWSRDGRVVCFDSGHTGARSLCTMKLPKDYEECELR